MVWSIYKGIFRFYLQAYGITDAAFKEATLLTLIEDTPYRMLANSYLPDEISTVYFDTIIAELEIAYCNKVSKLTSRVQFQFIIQHEGQSVDKYLADLRHFSINFGVGDQLDNRLKNQYVVGLKSDQIKKLLEDKIKKLADIVKRVRTIELVNRDSTSS